MSGKRRRRREWPRCCCGPRPPPLPAADDDIAAFLASFDVSFTRGFLPPNDPLVRLPQPQFQPHEDVALALPRLLASSTARPAIAALPVVSAATTHSLLAGDARQLRRALLLFGGLASAYVWGGGDDVVPCDMLPACIAVPLHQIGQELETPPILSHQSNCLYNWRPGIEKALTDPLRAQDLALAFSFTGDDNERMFYLLTLEIEAIGAQALPLLEGTRRVAAAASSSSSSEQEQEMVEALTQVRAFIQAMQQVLLSMPRFVDPSFFYTRVRPYLSGWGNNPTLPTGVLYQGVGTRDGGVGKRTNEKEGQRLQYSGGSAAQSSIITALDLYLGVDHNEVGEGSRSSYAFLKQMRAYMPKGHRRFLDELEEDMNAPLSIRRYVLGRQEENRALGKAYDGCVEALVAFRKSHLGIVQLYISDQQGNKGQEKGGLEKAAGGKGTGGSTPKEFLEPLRQQTVDALVLRRREEEV